MQYFGPDADAVIALVDKGAPGGALVLSGPTGSGKSTLLEAIAGECREARLVRADPGETDIPYAGLQRLVGPDLHRADGLPRWQRDALRQAVEGMPIRAGRLALGLAALGVLRERTLFLLVDDAHHLDHPSWEVLSFVARRLPGETVTLVATVPPGHPVGGLPVRRLARWDAATSRRMLAATVPGLPADVAAAVADLAGGSPGALADLAAGLTPAQRLGDAQAPVTLPRHSAVAAAFRATLDGLPADTRRLVLIAAAADDLRPSDLHAAALARGTGLDALAPAERAGLISTSGPVVTFAEPVTRAVAYHDAPLADRRAAHDLLARTLAAGGRRLPALIHRAAATAGPDEGLSRALIESAAGAAPRAAATALEHAARLTACPDAAAEASLAAARQAWTGGQRHRAALLLRAVPAVTPAAVGAHPIGAGAGAGASATAGASASATAGATASAGASAGAGAGAGVGASVGAARLDAEMRLRDGSAALAGDALLDHARRLAGHDVSAAAEALVLAGETRYLAGRHDRYQEIAREMAALRHEDGPPELTLAFCHVAGLAAMFRGDHAAAFPELRRVVELADHVPQPAALIRAAMAGLLTGDGAPAADLAARAVALARARGEAALVPQALEVSAFADLSAGRYEAATTAALDGVALAQACGQPRLAQSLLGTLAVLAALAGDRETCRLRIREAAVRDGAEGPDQARGLCEWALAVLDLVHDRPQATLDRLRPGLVAAAEHGNVVLQVAATPHLAEATWRCGELEPAADAALKDAFEGWAAITGKPAWLALRARCQALRAVDEDEAGQHFREALDLHATADFPRAHTELLYGRELRRRRRPGAARDHLRSALETFHLLDARPWAEQADGELRAAGEHVDRTGTAGLPLTAQQERIARLVADGATNREVAARMYLSPRTVDHHLRNVFIRLGVRSRTELARLMVSA
ncbi:hypothetical protein Acsp02_57760 [Actinoplanes sp. NBRC 103695]|nr:hypothetical protein Acsp02_57760 [Actinoplanes sp. NBRC 103695]